MELKYAGPKPIISHTGIEFDNNKEDKFVYLNIVVQLLKAIDHEYIKNKIYTYKVDTARLSNNEITQELEKYCPNLQQLIAKENHNIQDEIEHNIQRAHENLILSDADKITLENNINIMHDYLIQRSINKSVYYCAIEQLSQLLNKDQIDYIIVPMFQKFAHVLHSVQGSLKRQNLPIDSNLEIYQEDNKLLIKLTLIKS